MSSSADWRDVSDLASAPGAELRHATFRKGEPAHPSALLVTKFDTPAGVLASFSMFTTFGTPHDISLAALCVQMLFAADADTSAICQKSATETGGNLA